MQRFLAYLRDNVFLDFSGDLDVEQLRELLAGDDSPLSRALVSRVIKEGGIQPLLLALADCLLETVQEQLDDDTLREQVVAYVEA